MEWRFAGIRKRMIYIRAVFNEELAELPMSVKDGTVEIEILSKRLQRLSVREQEPNGADIAVVRAPADQRCSMPVFRCCRLTFRQVIEDQVCTSVDDSLKHQTLRPAPSASVLSVENKH